MRRDALLIADIFKAVERAARGPKSFIWGVLVASLLF